MQHLDLQVISQALQWSCSGQRVWLCTVLATYGSAPRAPGSLLAVNASGQWLGSLSGGCVEDDFLERVGRGEFAEPIAIMRYGDGSDPRSTIRLPCGACLRCWWKTCRPAVRCRPTCVRWRARCAASADYCVK